MSATGSAGVFTFESPWVVNHLARAFRMRSCSVLSVFPTIRSTSQRLHHKDIRESGDTVPPKRGPSNRPRGPSLLPTRSIARPVHERTWRHRRRTREDQGRGPHGRNLWSRDDGPWTQPDHPVHHRPRKPAAPGPRGHRDRSPDLCAELRHGRGLLGRSSCWIPNRETHGSDVHLAQQHVPPLRRSAPAHDGPSRTSPLRAADHRGLRAQSPRHPDFMFLTLWYATLHHHLVEAGLNDRFIWLARRRMLMGPGFSAAAILVSFVNPILSLGAYVLYPVFFIVPGRIDRLWRRQEVK